MLPEFRVVALRAVNPARRLPTTPQQIGDRRLVEFDRRVAVVAGRLGQLRAWSLAGEVLGERFGTGACAGRRREG